ncbi:transcription-repair-coupling factor [Novimethylophilus kurashikiensis]|uniref:Transcription-repair-coupling factor n=2 Tax=Novimethylophilus kurashikiensis TaxID=1825523 RepID=A0A2R5FDT7_9PROT|nr:transcription-repair-coupling factor [Novimethylophilus kurashikiensis]
MSDVNQVVDIFKQQSDLLTVTEVLILSPNHMNRKNKGESFQLNKVKQIWKHTHSQGHTFVLSNGERLSDCSNKARKMELLLNID